MQNYKVIIDEVVSHEYTIEANSPEEAESIAESYLDDGEEGAVDNREIFSIDSFEDEAANQYLN